MSTRSLNKVQLIGNLTRDPELRYTPQGTAVCSFGLATNRSWVTESGERKEDVEFHRIVAWAKLAELCSQLLFKGRKVYVEGRLQTRQWEGQDGVKRSTTEVVIDDMIVLDSRRQDGGGDYDAPEGNSAGGGDYVDDYTHDQGYNPFDDGGQGGGNAGGGSRAATNSHRSDSGSRKPRSAAPTTPSPDKGEGEGDMPF